MNATRIGRTLLATSVFLSGCFFGNDDDPYVPPVDEPSTTPQPLPEQCHVVNDGVAANTFQAQLLATDDGVRAAWIEFPDDLDGLVPAILAIAPVDAALAGGPATRVSLGTADWEDLLMPQVILPLGEQLLVIAGDTSALVSLADPTQVTPLALEPTSVAAAVALDGERVAMVDAADGGALRYRVLEVATATTSVEVELDDTKVDALAAPNALQFLGQAAQLVQLADGDLLALWVEGQTVARAARLHEDGTIVAGPADVAVALDAKTIFVPHAIELPEGELVIAWTGTSGTEVRASLLEADLTGPADAGVVVNAVSVGSQEYARPFLRDGSLGIAWNLQGHGISWRAVDVGDGKLVPTGADQDAVSGCAANLSSDLSILEDPDGGATAVWIDRGWEGEGRILAEPIR